MFFFLLFRQLSGARMSNISHVFSVSTFYFSTFSSYQTLLFRVKKNQELLIISLTLCYRTMCQLYIFYLLFRKKCICFITPNYKKYFLFCLPSRNPFSFRNIFSRVDFFWGFSIKLWKHFISIIQLRRNDRTEAYK